ncbi:MAG: AAA family ATPase [Gemmataceae bacterium]
MKTTPSPCSSTARSAPAPPSSSPREDETLWLLRQRRLDFGPDVGFWCRPFAGRPTPRAWHALIDELLQIHHDRRVDLVVIDPLAMFLPGNENNPASLLAALDDLHRLTHAGLAVLLLHHPAKGEPTLGQAARGTGALSACARHPPRAPRPPGDPATRRRRLFGFSRYEETPRRLSVELTPDATDYAICADTHDDEPFRDALPTIVSLLHHSATPMTRQQLLAIWPPPPPDPSTLWRWLCRATALGLLRRSGAGTKGDGYRYEVSDDSETM